MRERKTKSGYIWYYLYSGEESTHTHKIYIENRQREKKQQSPSRLYYMNNVNRRRPKERKQIKKKEEENTDWKRKSCVTCVWHKRFTRTLKVTSPRSQHPFIWHIVVRFNSDDPISSRNIILSIFFFYIFIIFIRQTIN